MTHASLRPLPCPPVSVSARRRPGPRRQKLPCAHLAVHITWLALSSVCRRPGRAWRSHLLTVDMWGRGSCRGELSVWAIGHHRPGRALLPKEAGRGQLDGGPSWTQDGCPSPRRSDSGCGRGEGGCCGEGAAPFLSPEPCGSSPDQGGSFYGGPRDSRQGLRSLSVWKQLQHTGLAARQLRARVFAWDRPSPPAVTLGESPLRVSVSSDGGCGYRT